MLDVEQLNASPAFLVDKKRSVNSIWAEEKVIEGTDARVKNIFISKGSSIKPKVDIEKAMCANQSVSIFNS